MGIADGPTAPLTEQAVHSLIVELRADANWLAGGAEGETVELERRTADAVERLLSVLSFSNRVA